MNRPRHLNTAVAVLHHWLPVHGGTVAAGCSVAAGRTSACALAEAPAPGSPPMGAAAAAGKAPGWGSRSEHPTPPKAAARAGPPRGAVQAPAAVVRPRVQSRISDGPDDATQAAGTSESGWGSGLQQTTPTVTGRRTCHSAQPGPHAGAELRSRDAQCISPYHTLLSNCMVQRMRAWPLPALLFLSEPVCR